MLLKIKNYFNFVFIAVFICSLGRNVYCQDEVETVSDEPAEPVESPAEETTTVSTVQQLDATKCGKKKRGCCDQLNIGNEQTLTKCFTLHQSKLPKEDERSPTKIIKFMSCFVECLYKQKKYIGKGDTINMKMVKLDAEKTYADRPKERDYHIKMYEFCRKEAMTTYNLIKYNPAGRLLVRDTCKPYFMFVFLCESDYHKKYDCPYFRWEGKRGTEHEATCTEAKEKCYELDGISLD